MWLIPQYWRRGKLNRDAIAYASTSFGSSLINNAFSFYYVKIFIDYYHVSSWWFQASQILFLFWNAINDPLFAYLQDNATWKCVKSRRISILYGAPLFCFAFLTFWFPWSTSAAASSQWICGLHLIFSLCFYDALLTFVLLAHCCLITEMSISYENRLDMKWYGVVAGLAGSWSVPFLNYISNNLNDMDDFRFGCILLAGISCLAMLYTGLNARTIYDNQIIEIEFEKGQLTGTTTTTSTITTTTTTTINSATETTAGDNCADVGLGISYCKLTMELLKNINFEAFVWTNFLQILHSNFLSNFTAIFIDRLAPGITSSFRTIYYALLFSGPSLAIIFGKPLISKFGYYFIMRCNCIWKIVGSLIMIILGRHMVSFYLLYVLIDTIMVHACFSLYDLALSDIADEDKRQYLRKKPITSMVFGTNALITKPAQSFAPMLTMMILNAYGYQTLVSQQAPVAVAHGLPIKSFGFTPPDLLDAMFYLNTILPLFIGLFQLVTWSFYNIRTTHV